MAGYAGFSKSNNAVSAELEGLLPATAAARELRVPAGFIRDEVAPDEWHHTSKMFNATNYYRVAEVREWLDSDEGQDRLEAWKTRQKALGAVRVYEDCRVTWLEWSGTRSHPAAAEHTAERATVTVKGQTATVRLEDGQEFRKRITSRGFTFRPGWTEEQRQLRELGRRVRADKAALRRRARAALTGARLEATDYFEWRDRHSKDSAKATWRPFTRAELDAALDASELWAAERTVERLEAGERDVVRVGLHIGVRRRPEPDGRDKHLAIDHLAAEMPTERPGAGRSRVR